MAGEQTGASGPADRGSGDSVRHAASETVDAVRQEASEIAGRATEQGKSMLSRQKAAAADHLDSVARALQGSARELEREEPAAGRYVGYAAARLQTMGHQLRDRDVEGLLDDVQDLGRRAPGAFFAGSVVAGFLMARFLKSSSEQRQGAGSWRNAASAPGVREPRRDATRTEGDGDLRGRSTEASTASDAATGAAGFMGTSGFGTAAPGTDAAVSPSIGTSGERHDR